MSKEWLSIPDVKSNTDTLGKQNTNYKTFYSCTKVSWEFVGSSPWPVLLPCLQSKMHSLTHSCSSEGWPCFFTSLAVGLSDSRVSCIRQLAGLKAKGTVSWCSSTELSASHQQQQKWRFAFSLNLPSFLPSLDLQQHVLPFVCHRMNLTAKEISSVCLPRWLVHFCHLSFLSL